MACKRWISLLIILNILFARIAFSQGVGVVLSGGGSAGIAHVGVLKALEENNIPIDFISGTSMGALVGGLYASGYSPSEIENIFMSDQFQDWALGKIDDQYGFYFKENEKNASWITFKFSLDTVFEANIPTSYIEPFPIDFGLMKLFAKANFTSKSNFDSLFIPFRCVAANITNKRLETFKGGDLATSIRASMSYPFFLSPIEMNDKLYFDGGIYNNFPSDLMCESFNPDYIIGSNVSSNFEKPKADNLLSQLKYMISQDTKYEINCKDGKIITPPIDVNIFDFSNVEEIINSGYQETIKHIESLKTDIYRRSDSVSLNKRRTHFKRNSTPILFNGVEIMGVNEAETKYISNHLKIKKDTIGLNRIEPKLISLQTDNIIKTVYPKIQFDSTDNRFKLDLDIKKEKKFFLSFGGNLSNKPISEGFIGLQYNHFGRAAININGNAYFGQFYGSVSGGIKLDFQKPTPFYITSNFVNNKWNYSENNEILIENDDPSFLIIKEYYAETGIGVPLGYKGKLEFGGLVANNKFEYYQDNSFTQFDTLDITKFNNTSPYILYERNSLNRKQYATEGSLLSLKARYIDGKEETTPGSTSLSKEITTKKKNWYRVKFMYDKYFNKKGKMKLGFLAEGVYSNQPFFSNYISSVLNSSGFEPIPESKTLFQERFYAHNYVASGVRLIYSFTNRMDLRVEAFGFQPYREIQDVNKQASYGERFSNRHYIGSTSAVFHSPLGPIALSVNYYKQDIDNVSLLFHFGYIIFNKRAHE